MRFFLRRFSASRVENDFQSLLARMKRRLFPETLPVLAFFWLKSLHTSGYRFREWKELNGLLERVLRDPPGDEIWRQVLIDTKAWIYQRIVLPGHAPDFRRESEDPISTSVGPEELTAYIVRLLNEWLPVEVARLLVKRNEFTMQQDEGIPAWAFGSALERVLVRSSLSRSTLEALLQLPSLSPEWVYPGDLEILRDVVLALLGQTQAPVPSVLPATLFCVARGSRFPADYREALRHAECVSRPDVEEIHVPLAPARALDILTDETVHIGSIVVTLDGRAWESESLQSSGDQHCVVYRPIGCMRINYSGEHAEVRAPWPEERRSWSGTVHHQGVYKVFGREWRGSKWVVDERTWLDLVFSRMLPTAEILAAQGVSSCRLRPASVDIAWAALEQAVTASITQNNLEPIEQLRHFDLIPIGRAIVGLAEAKIGRRSPIEEMLKTHLKALRYLETSILSTYGRVPWKILPRSIRATFLRGRVQPVVRGLLNEVFEGLPDAISQVDPKVSFEQAPHSTSPHAA